ncbi:MAG: DNA starvation/stationary phase protection protein Dps [Acidobacteriaceae bacterium]
MYKNRVALSDVVKKKVVDLLNVSLAEAFDMYSQIKFAHWNVKGLNFYQLHLLFDKIAEDVEGQVDEIAERITALGGVANATVRQAATSSRLPEYKVEAISGPDHLKSLSAALANYAKALRDVSEEVDNAGDDPTHDFFNQMIIVVEQDLYFLESHLESGDSQ